MAKQSREREWKCIREIDTNCYLLLNVQAEPERIRTVPLIPNISVNHLSLVSKDQVRTTVLPTINQNIGLILY